MADSGTATILRRKAAQARDGTGAVRGQQAPGRVLAEAFRRAAEVELELSVTATQPRERRAGGAEIVDGLPEHAFLAVLQGPGDGAGLMMLDPGALSAVIEMRTIGRVSARAPAPRRPTQIDAAMAADLVDRILSEFEAPLLPTEEARWSAGWRYQLFLPEPRPLSVVLEEAAYRVFDVSLVFGAAAKEGQALLALPLPGRGRRVPPPPPASGAEAGTAQVWVAALRETVASAEAVLDAQLGRVRLPLGALAALKPGDRLALPLSALAAVRLVAPGGSTVTGARLGQTGGLRAVRIRSAAPEGLSSLAEGTVIAKEEGRAAAPSGFAAALPGAVDSASGDRPEHPGAAATDPAPSRSLADIDTALGEALPGLDLLTGARRAGAPGPESG